LLSLRKDGEGPVTADIQTPHDVEIVNPRHVIVNLSHGGKIDMQIKVENGRGYVPGNQRRYDESPEVDRSHRSRCFPSLGEACQHTVESARVEQHFDWTSWFSRLETNGAVSAEDAVRAS
jgi:DNA-directed RNA polymerase subunit alpha